MAVASRPRSRRRRGRLCQPRANPNVGHCYHQQHRDIITIHYPYTLAARERHSSLRQVSQPLFSLPPHTRRQPTPRRSERQLAPEHLRTATQLCSIHAHFQRVRALALPCHALPAACRRPSPNTSARHHDAADMLTVSHYRVRYQRRGSVRIATAADMCCLLFMLCCRAGPLPARHRRRG